MLKEYICGPLAIGRGVGLGLGVGVKEENIFEPDFLKDAGDISKVTIIIITIKTAAPAVKVSVVK